jgi:hypothetical protein
MGGMAGCLHVLVDSVDSCSKDVKRAVVGRPYQRGESKGATKPRALRTLLESTSDEFTVRVADKPEEVKALLEVGSDYVCQKDSLIFMRKRK